MSNYLEKWKRLQAKELASREEARERGARMFQRRHDTYRKLDETFKEFRLIDGSCFEFIEAERGRPAVDIWACSIYYEDDRIHVGAVAVWENKFEVVRFVKNELTNEVDEYRHTYRTFDEVCDWIVETFATL